MYDLEFCNEEDHLRRNPALPPQPSLNDDDDVQNIVDRMDKMAVLLHKAIYELVEF